MYADVETIVTDINPNTILVCPDCRDKNDRLHQLNVNIYERNEDDEKGLHVEVKSDRKNNGNNSEAVINSDLTGNPSRRRQGIVIDFWCEQCDEIYKLNISQHKGITEIYWEY